MPDPTQSASPGDPKARPEAITAAYGDCRAGRYEQARDALHAALRVLREQRPLRDGGESILLCLMGLVRVEVGLGRPDRAARLYAATEGARLHVEAELGFSVLAR